jgi:protein-tyrosine phosphatase
MTVFGLDKWIQQYPMNRIWDRLYLGSFYAAENLKRGNPEGIEFVVNCTPDPVIYQPPLTSIVLNLDDGHGIPEEKFWTAMKAMQEAMWAGKTVLVHCHAGISRSSTIVAAYMYLTGWNDIDKAVEYIVSKRPVVKPHPEVLLSVKKHLKIWPYDGSLIST